MGMFIFNERNKKGMSCVRPATKTSNSTDQGLLVPPVNDPPVVLALVPNDLPHSELYDFRPGSPRFGGCCRRIVRLIIIIIVNL